MNRQLPPRRGLVSTMTIATAALLAGAGGVTPAFSASGPVQHAEGALTPVTKSSVTNKAEFIARARGMVTATTIPVAVMRMETTADGSVRPVCTVKSRPAPMQHPGLKPQAQGRGE